jgi:hypothetical protein
MEEEKKEESCACEGASTEKKGACGCACQDGTKKESRGLLLAIAILGLFISALSLVGSLQSFMAAANLSDWQKAMMIGFGLVNVFAFFGFAAYGVLLILHVSLGKFCPRLPLPLFIVFYSFLEVINDIIYLANGKNTSLSQAGYAIYSLSLIVYFGLIGVGILALIFGKKEKVFLLFRAGGLGVIAFLAVVSLILSLEGLGFTTFEISSARALQWTVLAIATLGLVSLFKPDRK